MKKHTANYLKHPKVHHNLPQAPQNTPRRPCLVRGVGDPAAGALHRDGSSRGELHDDDTADALDHSSEEAADYDDDSGFFI